MIKLINGWTKETVMAQVKKYNNGKQSLDDRSEGCVYLGINGNRCAVGCFIPDGHPALQSDKGSSEIISEYPELEKLMPFELGDLRKFQYVHDRANSYRNIHEAIQEFLDTKVE